MRKETSLRNIILQGMNSVFYICQKELKAVFKDQGVLIFFLLVPLAYPLLYAFIYTGEVVREGTGSGGRYEQIYSEPRIYTQS